MGAKTLLEAVINEARGYRERRQALLKEAQGIIIDPKELVKEYPDLCAVAPAQAVFRQVYENVKKQLDLFQEILKLADLEIGALEELVLEAKKEGASTHPPDRVR